MKCGNKKEDEEYRAQVNQQVFGQLFFQGVTNVNQGKTSFSGVSLYSNECLHKQYALTLSGQSPVPESKCTPHRRLHKAQLN